MLKKEIYIICYLYLYVKKYYDYIQFKTDMDLSKHSVHD